MATKKKVVEEVPEVVTPSKDKPKAETKEKSQSEKRKEHQAKAAKQREKLEQLDEEVYGRFRKSDAKSDAG